jgi:5-methylcytosine-specific restriction enzyme A
MNPTIPEKKVWLFQANPRRYDIFNALRDDAIKESTWTVTRYQREISSGDIGILWVSGKNSGIYAIFDIISNPQSIIDDEVSRKYWVDKNEADTPKLRIKYRYRLKLLKPLLKSEVQKIDGLKDLQVLKQPQGTNFTVTNDEWQLIMQEIENMQDVFPEEPHTVDSWAIIDSNVTLKKMDRSSFIHHGTGIPKEEIRDFFNLHDVPAGYRRSIKLIYGNTSYSAVLRADIQPNPRTQLLWHSDFASMIQSLMPLWHQHFSKNYDLLPDRPEMRFEKTKQPDEYSVEFIDPKQIEQDTSAEIDDSEEQVLFQEGKIQYFFGKRYERIPENRRRAIEIHGLKCSICGFDFERVYGERGRGFIEVHHTKPLNQFSTEEYVNPDTDLFPVCSNCHRMIHRRNDSIISIEDMKKLFYK